MIWIIFIGFLIFMFALASQASNKKVKEQDHPLEIHLDDDIEESTEENVEGMQSSSELGPLQGYSRINFAIKGTSYRSPSDIKEARKLRVGDAVYLIHEENNTHDDFAMMVKTSNGAHIGYVEKQYSLAFFSFREYVIKCVISKVVGADVPFLYANAYFSKFRDPHPMVDVSTKLITPRSMAIENNIIVADAEKLKYSEPMKAAEMFLEAASTENGLYSLHQACICYRNAHAFDKEIELINQILLVCEDEDMQDYIPEYQRRLSYVKRLKASAEKKKAKQKPNK